MSILKRSERQVKPTRVSPREPSPFGAGVLPAGRWSGQFAGDLPYSQGDAEWAASLFGDGTSAAEFEAREAEYDAMIDQEELEMAMLDRYTRMNLPL